MKYVLSYTDPENHFIDFSLTVNGFSLDQIIVQLPAWRPGGYELGNFSKNFILNQKILFGLGASIASFVFFFLIGYLSSYLSKYAQSDKVWKVINIFIISFMSLLTIYVLIDIIS